MKSGQSFILILLLFIMYLYSCSTSVAPIRYGKDACASCMMTIMDERFGAEVITRKGKVYKFDDMMCLMRFLHAETIPVNEISKTLVINFEEKNDFIEAENAFYCISESLHSPMNGNAAAFRTEDPAHLWQNNVKGELISWEKLTQRLIK